MHKASLQSSATTLNAERPKERRILIADAALKLLAREGDRGLTHRAVDAELDLPGGSTSYYFRTRSALVLAAAERLLELDMADLKRQPEGTGGIASLLECWLAPKARSRSLARMELLLAAARDPKLEFMVRSRKRFVDRAAQAQGGAQDHEARISATALVALVDGLTLHGLVTGGLSRSAAAQMLARLQSPRPVRSIAPPGKKLSAKPKRRETT